MLTPRSFAGAPSQSPGTPLSSPEREFGDIARMLASSALEVCRHLLPAGQARGHEYVAGSLHGDRGDSLSVNLKTGVWKDFATGEGGGDLINLWAARHRIPQFQAKREAEAWLGLESGGGERPVPAGGSRVATSAQPAPSPTPTRAADEDPFWYAGQMPERTWHYHDATGACVATIFRFVHPTTGEKAVRPWNPVTNRWGIDDKLVRPLYALAEIAKRLDSHVVVVEGEKCADVGRALQWVTTTAMMGAQSTAKTDWSPLRGRDVILWPDNDTSGQKWLEDVSAALREVGAASVRVVQIPEGKPEKWDIADADEKEARQLLVEATKAKPIVTGRPPLRITDWTPGRFTGIAPERQWLVREVLPLRVAAILAAMGDTGKGMLTLNLAMQVAGGKPHRVNPPMAFGCRIDAFGGAVILAGEDDHDEIHRRMHGMDPSGALRHAAGDRLMVVPMPNAGGAPPLVRSTPSGSEMTDEFARLRDQILAVEDIKLIVVDPLASFVHADINKDSAAVQFVMNVFATLASETGATVLLSHHMRKAGGAQDKVMNADSARAAIRGQSGLVDGSRVSYALWQPADDEAKRLLKSLSEPVKGDAWRNRIVKGAVVKSNGPADRTVRTYLRNEVGLLEDVTDRTRRVEVEVEEDLAEAMIESIKIAAEAGQPFQATKGAVGVANPSMSSRMVGVAREVSGGARAQAVQKLLDAKRLVLAKASGTSTMWLDVPNGPFDKGLGEFSRGGWTPSGQFKSGRPADTKATFREEA